MAPAGELPLQVLADQTDLMTLVALAENEMV